MWLLENDNLLPQARAAERVTSVVCNVGRGSCQGGVISYVPGFWSVNGLNSTVREDMIDLCLVCNGSRMRGFCSFVEEKKMNSWEEEEREMP